MIRKGEKDIRWMRWLLFAVVFNIQGLSAQSLDKQRRAQVDSVLASRYYSNKGNLDTTYLIRPQTKWTITARMNVSGAKLEVEGNENGRHFKSEMSSDRKATLSLGVSHLGLSLSLSLNPAKLKGKYSDYELNFNLYGKRLGLDFIYQDAKNFNGWFDYEGHPRFDLPANKLSVKTLNINTYYVFNSRRFSYPAAFTQSYIQRRSAGSALMALSAQGQHAMLKATSDEELEQLGLAPEERERAMNWKEEMHMKMTNIGIGAGYGYNYVPSQKWLLHISALPTFIFYSHTSMTIGENRVPLHYHFPEAIITGRGAVVHQWSNKFCGISMVFNFTNIGDKEELSVHNIKWRARTFFGLRF